MAAPRAELGGQGSVCRERSVHLGMEDHGLQSEDIKHTFLIHQVWPNAERGGWPHGHFMSLQRVVTALMGLTKCKKKAGVREKPRASGRKHLNPDLTDEEAEDRCPG